MMEPFISFYGGKYRAAPRYPAPAHDVIVEPFAGSAGYSVRHHAKRVILIDLDEQVIGTWQYLIAATPEEILRLPLLEPGQDVRDLNLPQESRWLIGWWLNKGMTAPCNRLSAWAANPGPGQVNTYWGPGVRARIARQVPAIRHWTAWLGSYETAPGICATWFIDPPYRDSGGHRYRRSNRAIDYADLGEWCRSRTGQVMVCEGPGADWLPFRAHLTIKGTEGRRRTGVSRETIWTKGEDVGQGRGQPQA